VLENDLVGIQFVGYAVVRGVENIVLASNDKTDDLAKSEVCVFRIPSSGQARLSGWLPNAGSKRVCMTNTTANCPVSIRQRQLTPRPHSWK